MYLDPLRWFPIVHSENGAVEGNEPVAPKFLHYARKAVVLHRALLPQPVAIGVRERELTSSRRVEGKYGKDETFEPPGLRPL